MKWNPEKAENDFLLAAGTYDAVVQSAEEKTSKSGNEMFEIVLEVYPDDGPRPKVWDYLIPEKALWKLKHLLESAGKADLFKSGTMEASALVGLNVKVALDQQREEGYKPKNKVIDYIVRDEAAPDPADEPDDSVPF